MNKKDIKKAIAHDLAKSTADRKTTGKQDESSLRTEEIHEHGKHPNSIANLKQFEKGISGNPGGRPRKYEGLKKALDRMGVEIAEYDFWDMPPADCKTRKDQVLWRIWRDAVHGDSKMIALLVELGCLND